MIVIIGDSLDLDCSVTENGDPVDITGWDITCQIRGENGRLLHEFQPVITDSVTGTYKMTADTRQWRTGTYQGNVRYTDSYGRKMSSLPFSVKVIQSITE